MAYNAEARAREAEFQENLKAAGGSSSLAPLPPNREQLLALRKTAPKKVLNDYVEQCFLAMYDEVGHEMFTRLLSVCYNTEAVEGSTKADDIEAARLMREYANKVGVPMIPDMKLETVSKSLNVVMRRYGISKGERRALLDGRQFDLGLKEEA